MNIESTHTHNNASSSDSGHQNARLALKLVAVVIGIFLVTLWKFRPL